MKKKLAIIGSTGKVGIQTLKLVAQFPDKFEVEILSTDKNTKLLLEQVKVFKPNAVVVTNESAYQKAKSDLENEAVKVFCGEEAVCEVVQWDVVDMVVMATIGFNSINATLAAMDAKKKIAMGNKEVMVAAGELLKNKILENDLIFLPLSNTLSSIYQSLLGEDTSLLSKIILTTPGGPFIDKKTNFLINVKRDHAMQDSNPDLDDKTLIDIASLMDGGVEMLITKYFFGLPDEAIDLVVHPQDNIHSMVLFKDGTTKTLLGQTNMETSILFALSFPKRLQSNLKPFSLKDSHKLTLSTPDNGTFTSLNHAKEAMQKGHNMPCILNAANEVVVQAFLDNKIGFLEMNDMIAKAMAEIEFIENPGIDELIKTDIETRKFTSELTKHSQLYN